MVRDGTYLVGTCALITKEDCEIVFQSHIFKIRVEQPDKINLLLLLALLSCPIVKSQIYAKRFTQDIIDTLGERIHELQLPIPKNEKERRKIINKVKQIVSFKKKAKDLTREVISDIVPTDGNDTKFMTLIVD